MKPIEIEPIKIKAVDTTYHRQELRRALLTSSHWNKKSSTLLNMIFFLKGGEKYMNLKKFTFASLIVAVLVAGVFTLTGNKSGGSTVYAKELVEKSINVLTSLPAGQKQTLGVPTDAISVLNEAKNAKDLKVLTYDEVKNRLPTEGQPGVGAETRNIESGPSLETGTEESGKHFLVSGNPPTDAVEKLKTAKFLEFTNSQGADVLIGVDQENVPIFTLIGFGK